MVRRIGNRDQGIRLARLLAPPDGVFGEWEMARARGEDILPCLGFGERELVGSNADNVAVATVDILDIVDQVAAVEGADKS